MEGAIHYPVEIFLQQSTTLASCSQEYMEVLGLYTIITYTSWLEAELEAGQVTEMIGNRDATILNL